MHLPEINITEESFVSDVVRKDYRTARVFRKHEIDYCCGGKWTLAVICEMKGLNFYQLKKELTLSAKTVQLSNTIRFDTWSIDFLTDYIVNIHHHYLRDALPQVKKQLDHFTVSHSNRYVYLAELQDQFHQLYDESFPHLAMEEEILFPYIRQVAHAYHSRESYASLLVRTLRKPVENVMQHEHETISKILNRIRLLTDNYQSPSNACVSHGVTFSLLKELDNDLVQHVYLENQILFPRAIAMEKELLIM